MLRPFRHAWRRLVKTPWPSASVVASLALGLGANTLAFSLVGDILSPAMPGIDAPEELIHIHRYTERAPERLGSLPFETYVELATSAPSLRDVAAFSQTIAVVRSGLHGERVSAHSVTASYFSTLGVQPAVGRLLAAEDASASHVVLGHDLWQRAFAGDRGVVGSSIEIGGQPLTVVGVTERGFAGIDRVDRPELFFPIALHHRLTWTTGRAGSRRPSVHILARLAGGATLETARSEAIPIAESMSGGGSIGLVPVATGVFRTETRSDLLRYPLLLLAVLLLVLLLACFNLGSGLLARHEERRREIGLRLCLGASRRTVLAQVGAEVGILVGLGAAGGLLVARLGLPMLDRLELPVTATLSPRLDVRVLAFSALLAALLGVALATVPTLRLAVTSPVEALRSRSAPRWRSAVAGDLLIATQIAVALLVVLVTVLFAQSFLNVRAIPLGFEPRGVLVASLDLFPLESSAEQSASFADELRRRIESLPEVGAATVGGAGQPLGGLWATFQIEVPGYSSPDGRSRPAARHALVDTDYFRTLGIRLREGRQFRESDGSASPAVAIVNETMARELWPPQTALGRVLTPGLATGPVEIVGVVEDARDRTLREEAPWFVYLPIAQHENYPAWAEPMLSNLTLMAQAAGSPRRAAGALAKALQELDERVLLFDVTSLDQLTADGRRSERQASVVFAGASLLTLVLASLGLSGLLAAIVAQRRRELAVRMALGAAPAEIHRLLLARVSGPCLVGLLLGLAAAWGSARLLEGLLYGVAPLDPVSLVLSCAILASTAASGTLGPARRAGRMDPAQILRAE